jgi:hypothetical protein
LDGGVGSGQATFFDDVGFMIKIAFQSEQATGISRDLDAGASGNLDVGLLHERGEHRYVGRSLQRRDDPAVSVR